MSAIVDLMLAGLKNPAPVVRIETLRVLAMLEETLALPALRAMMTAETDADVLPTLKWAGSLIWRAQQSGYTTENGMHQHFRLDLLPTEDQKKEEELLERMQYQFDMDMLKAQQASQNRKIRGSIVSGAIGAALSGPAMSANLLLSGAKSGPTLPSNSTPAPMIGAQPITPQRPTDHNISIWLRRLDEPDESTRQKVIIELRSLNNPKALPALGARFALDTDAKVRDEAQRCGKALYFNWVYWAPKSAATDPARPAAPSDVAQILAKAEAAREARKKKG